ncbi:PREDICTED: proline-rich antigen homolog [Priapulus caudatus]|uniref:Proline-rich antigen homolog n=1 Tax=Priapulus caudatus TaxID=37621 RepID=A0ABM1EBQ5_PRICU|nr:PREDICTED: proline-rich antigen homolog [Priapulus caudatus]
MTSTAGGTSQAPPISSPWNQGYSGASGIPPWQGSGMMGVPPPVPPPMGVAPPPPPPTSGGAAPQVNAFDFSALAAVGLPSLLAPPPPPPS